MSYIMSKSTDENQQGEIFNPFCRHPGGTEDLLWARPNMLEKPMELLCNGMSLILSSPLGTDCFKDERKTLAKRFLYLFRTWCLDREYGAIKDPPTEILDCPPPWEIPACAFCKCRVADNKL